MKKLKQYAISIQAHIMKLQPEHSRLMHFYWFYFPFMFFTLFYTDIVSLGIVTVLATLKELSDKYIKKGIFDWWDLFFSVLSGLIITILNIVSNGL